MENGVENDYKFYKIAIPIVSTHPPWCRIYVSANSVSIGTDKSLSKPMKGYCQLDP